MDSLFIDDGYQKDGQVAAEPGLHGALAFRFRPALLEERLEFARDGTAGRAYAKKAAALLDKHVIDWEAKDGKGQTVQKSADAFLRLHPNVFNKMVDQVLGYTAADQAEAAKN